MKFYLTRLPVAIFLGLLLFVVPACAISHAQKASASPTPAEQRRPQAKTKAELADYNTAYAVSGGDAMEKAATDFAAKYPTSELRGFLYSKAMHEFQIENRPDKILAMAEKVLSVDPDNPLALVMSATILSDVIKDDDKDRQKKIDTAIKNATRALQTVDTGLPAPAAATPEQFAAYKNSLRSMAHSALGITELKAGDNAAAEKELRASADLNKAAPDGFVLYHLSLALDHQHRNLEALDAVQDALRALKPEEDIAKLAQGERVRLVFQSMLDYQTENVPDKMLAICDKALAYAPNDPVALALSAFLMADSLSDSDKDPQKAAAIRKNANSALQNVDAGFAAPGGASASQVAVYKTYLRTKAHMALGMTALKTGDDAGAEKELKATYELNKSTPDGFVMYHLALAQDHQQKYAEALNSVEIAVRVLAPNDDLMKLAQGERSRLTLLVKPVGTPK